eukprot:scaffold932_cov328-Pavlova_lutheri.AAC.25
MGKKAPHPRFLSPSVPGASMGRGWIQWESLLMFGRKRSVSKFSCQMLTTWVNLSVAFPFHRRAFVAGRAHSHSFEGRELRVLEGGRRCQERVEGTGAREKVPGTRTLQR